MSAQRHNLVELVDPPSSGDLAGAGNAAEEGDGAHGSPDLEVSKVVGEVEQPVSKFDAGYVLANIDAIVRRPFDECHANSPRSYPERFEIEADKLNSGNPRIPLPDINAGWFRPTAIIPRRTAEQMGMAA